MKKSLIAIAILAFAGTAYAGNHQSPDIDNSPHATHNENRNNNANNNNNIHTNSNINANTNTNANNNTNANANLNNNTQGQQQGQGQLQGQLQGQGQQQGITGSGNSSSSSSANNHNDVKANSTSSVNIAAQERDPVSTATAPALQAANGTCMGSTSVGGQGVAFGISVGSTWVDAGCDARYDANSLIAAGQEEAAIARLCMKPEIAEAMKNAGKSCEAVKTSVAPANQEVKTTVVMPQYTDPIIRRRMGLDPFDMTK